MKIYEVLRSYSQSDNMLIEPDRCLVMATSRDKNQDTDNEKHSQSQSSTSLPLVDSDLNAEGNNEEIISEDRIESQQEEDFVETCSCGHSRNHHLVTPRATYTAWGTFWITIMGVSATPIRVDFICRICNEKFDFEIDPERLKDFY